jgi:ferredoxin
MKTVERKKLGELMQAALDSGMELIAPVQDGSYSAYKAIDSPSRAAMELPLARMPLKEFFLPKTECLFKFEPDGEGGVKIAEPAPVKDRVVFGARPCDAASLPIMDKVFTWDYNDSLYLARREKTTVVTFACEKPLPSCRCESVGLSPVEKQGTDVFFTPVDSEHFMVEALTEKGERLVALWGNKLGDASDADAKKAEQSRAALTGKQTDVVRHRAGLKAKFGSAAWDELTMKCLGCGACAYLCPTCHCFDIVDEKKDESGARVRNWDACAFSTFTLHGSGHNPRAEQWQRYRQRVMHKFDYYPEKFGPIACVGCGRCISACPVGMDIFEIIEKVTADE